ncbi:MAG: hypothetical protein EHM35_18320, partial [Planctomycetaceae bacterium]
MAIVALVIWLVIPARNPNGPAQSVSTIVSAGQAPPERVVAKDATESQAANSDAAKSIVARENQPSLAPKEKGQQEASTPAAADMSTMDFMAAFGEAVLKGEPGGIHQVLQKAPRSAECIEALKGCVTAESSSKELRGYASEALMRMGSKEAVGFVLDQALAAEQAGNSGLVSRLLSSLQWPASAEGAQTLLELLLGQRPGVQGPLPEQFNLAVRRALREAPDRAAVGNLAAQLYLEAESSGNQAAMTELLNGVGLPSMMSALAVRAYGSGSLENATQFLDRLAQLDDQGAVEALVQAGGTEPHLFNAAAERLYNWSVQHPQQAVPGVFFELVTDANRSPSQRML